MSAYTPRASLSVGGNRGSAAILLTDTAAQLCAAFFDRPGYPAARCTFRPAFTDPKLAAKEAGDMHYEQLQGQYHGTFTIRLSQEHRVVFTIIGHEQVVVRQIGGHFP